MKNNHVSKYLFVALVAFALALVLFGATTTKSQASSYVTEEGYITFSSDDIFSFGFGNFNSDVTLYVSTDAVNWTLCTSRTSTYSDLGSDGMHHVYLRGEGNDTGLNTSSSYVSIFLNRYDSTHTNTISCSGNIETLLDWEKALAGYEFTLDEYAFYSLFSCCSLLTSAPDLPTMNLAPYCYNDMFEGCTRLATAPELPATTLSAHCYDSMFVYCSNLSAAPELPATTLAEYCYYQMFYECTSMTEAPSVLPAETLFKYCYAEMFRYCTSLETVPVISATSMAKASCRMMFLGCETIEVTPELPCTDLAEYCYYQMFYECNSITETPELSATTVPDYAYYRMFSYCEKLYIIHDMPATEVGTSAYDGMFAGCSLLSISATYDEETYAHAWTIGAAGSSVAMSMFGGSSGVTTPSSNTTYYINHVTEEITVDPTCTNDGYTSDICIYEGCGHISSNWRDVVDMLEHNYGSTVSVTGSTCGSYTKKECADCGYICLLSYSTSHTWNSTVDVTPTCVSTGTTTHTCSKCGGCYIETTAIDSTNHNLDTTTFSQVGVSYYAYKCIDCEGDVYTYSNSDVQYVTFSSESSFAMSYSSTYQDDFYLFYSTDATTWKAWDGSTIPAASKSGSYVIYICGRLNTTFASSASAYTTLQIDAEEGTVDCSGNIETLLDWCTVADGDHPTMDAYAFACFFMDCAALATTPELGAETMSSHGYYKMFSGCTGIVSAAAIPATTLSPYCYYYMYENCTKLMYLPEFQSVKLVEGCYWYMFTGCTRINVYASCTDSTPHQSTIINAVDTDSAEACTNMFYNTSSVIETPGLNHYYYQAHVWEEIVAVVESTCSEQGYTEYKCIYGDCECTTKTDYVETLDHDYARSQEEGTITYTCNDCGSTYTAYDLAYATIELSGSTFTYTGYEIYTNVTVIYNGATLSNGGDYVVEYSDNINAGTCTVTAVGQADVVVWGVKYEGTISATFTIEKADTYIQYSSSTLEAIKVGETMTISTYVESGATVKFESSDTSVLVVDANGVVTGTGVGFAYVYMTTEETANYNAGYAQDFCYVIAGDVTNTNSTSTTESEDDTTTTSTSTTSTSSTTTIKKGKTYTKGNYKYKVTKVAASNAQGTVTLTGVAKKVAKVKVPATIKLADGKTYKVTAIGAKAFKGNKKMTSLTVTKNVKTIGANAFAGCTKLKTVKISSTALTSIGASAFASCTKLTSVTISSTKLKTIGKNAFKGDKKLKKIVLKTTALKTVGANAIKGIYAKAVIKMPSKKLKAYTKLFASKTGFKKTMSIKK